MERAKVLAFILLLISAASMANAALPAAKSPSQISILKPSLNPQLLAPYINIYLIKIAPASSGNSKPVNISINITSPVTQQDICGLNAANFMIDTLGILPNAPSAYAIKGFFPISSVAINQPIHCDYMLSIVPTSSSWVTGIYTLKLNYIQGGQQLANRTFSFRV
jgi:hypothetical protein